MDIKRRYPFNIINSKIWTKEEEMELVYKIENEIKFAWKKAMNDPYPSQDSTLKFVYSNDK